MFKPLRVQTSEQVLWAANGSIDQRAYKALEEKPTFPAERKISLGKLETEYENEAW